MAFTNSQRVALRKARITVVELEIEEQRAVTAAAETCREAGLALLPGASWHDLVHNHADAIRDALEPFDSGVRINPERA